MAAPKPSLLEAWSAQNQEKARALLQGHLAADEELRAYAVGWDYPLDLLTWLPLIGDLITMRKKRYLLGVTGQRLLVLRLRTFRWEGMAAEAIAVAAVKRSAVRKFPLHCNLEVELEEGRLLRFKEMRFEGAAALKDALDQAQGRPSTFD